MCFLSNFGCKIIFMCSVNFWHQQDSSPMFEGSIGHVTSYYKWPFITSHSVSLSCFKFALNFKWATILLSLLCFHLSVSTSPTFVCISWHLFIDTCKKA